MMVGALGMAGSLISYEAMNEGPINTRNLVGKVLSDGDAKQKVETKAKEAKEAGDLAERNKVPKVAVALPADAKDVKQTNDSINFSPSATLPGNFGQW